MNSSFAEYAADSRNPRRIALGGGDRGIKTVLGRIVERLRFASRRNGCFGGNFCAYLQDLIELSIFEKNTLL